MTTVNYKHGHWYSKPRSRRKGLIALAFLMPGLIYYIMFRYAPMWGNLIAFQDYNPFKGMMGSKFIEKTSICVLKMNRKWRLFVGAKKLRLVALRRIWRYFRNIQMLEKHPYKPVLSIYSPAAFSAIKEINSPFVGLSRSLKRFTPSSWFVVSRRPRFQATSMALVIEGFRRP